MLEVALQGPGHAVLGRERPCGIIRIEQPAGDEQRTDPLAGEALLRERTRQGCWLDPALLDQDLSNLHHESPAYTTPTESTEFARDAAPGSQLRDAVSE